MSGMGAVGIESANRSVATFHTSAVASYTLNEAAVEHARRLIDARQYVLDSDWGEVQPNAEDENTYLAKHSWEEYGAWHLGLTDGANDETKARHAFVFGDFRRIHRSAIIACHFPRGRVASQGDRAGRSRAAPAPRRDERLLAPSPRLTHVSISALLARAA
jgi:hypothetical protein